MHTESLISGEKKIPDCQSGRQAANDNPYLLTRVSVHEEVQYEGQIAGHRHSRRQSG